MNNLISLPPTSLADFSQYLVNQLQPYLQTNSIHKSLFLERKPRDASTITDIVSHLIEFLPCTFECFLIGLIYLHRIEKRYKRFVNSGSIAKLYATAVIIASKFHDDDCYGNTTLASFLTVKTQQLMKMELEFLSLLEFRCFFSQEEFNIYLHELKPRLESVEYPGLEKRKLRFSPSLFI